MALDPNYPYVRNGRINVAACGECPLYIPERAGEPNTDFCKGWSPYRPIGELYPYPEWCPLQSGTIKVKLLH
jgi:hypothetical protein